MKKFRSTMCFVQTAWLHFFVPKGVQSKFKSKSGEARWVPSAALGRPGRQAASGVGGWDVPNGREGRAAVRFLLSLPMVYMHLLDRTEGILLNYDPYRRGFGFFFHTAPNTFSAHPTSHPPTLAGMHAHGHTLQATQFRQTASSSIAPSNASSSQPVHSFLMPSEFRQGRQ